MNPSLLVSALRNIFVSILFFKILYIGYFMIEFIGNHTSNGLLTLTTIVLEKVGRKRIITDRTDEEPYLERYYLFFKDRETFPFNIFIHKFLKSDPDDLHDHPWGFRTLILKGGYWEHTEEGKFWRHPGYIGFRSANNLHRVDLKPGTKPLTLFISGPFGLRKGSRSEYGIDFKKKKQ